MTNIIIEISKGILSYVYSNKNDVRFIIIDHDNIDAEVYESESKDENSFDLSAADPDFVDEDIALAYTNSNVKGKRTKRLAEIIKREFNH